MWCYDQTSCDYRYKNALYSMSSLTWKDSFSQGGIFEDNPVKSPIAGANKAFVTYCSSDAWVGDGISYGYSFRGQRIVAAVLASLVQKQGMGSVSDTRLIFGGCSAGGRGAAFNVDYVGDILTRAGAPDVAVYGLLDAALWIDIPPAVPGIVSQQCQTAALAVMANATARLDADCVAAYPGSESWKCLYGCGWQLLFVCRSPSEPRLQTVPHAVHQNALHYAGQPGGHISDRDQHKRRGSDAATNDTRRLCVRVALPDRSARSCGSAAYRQPDGQCGVQPRVLPSLRCVAVRCALHGH